MAEKRLHAKKNKGHEQVKEPESVKLVESVFKKRKKLIFSFLILAVIVLLLVVIGGGSGKVIKEGSKVKLHYTGTLDDGSVFDSSLNKQPLEFVVGAGQVIKGFEQGVIGMKLGDKKKIHIPSDQAYGPYNKENIGEFPKSKVPKEMELKVGVKVFLESQSNGGIAIATVLEIKNDTLVLDLNHPLAGKNLNFEVEILDVA